MTKKRVSDIRISKKSGSKKQPARKKSIASLREGKKTRAEQARKPSSIPSTQPASEDFSGGRGGYKPPRNPRRGPQPERRGGKFLLWVIAVVAVVAAGLLTLSLFGGASIAVVPKQEQAHVDGTFQARLSGQDTATSSRKQSGLTYQLVTLSQEAQATIPAEEERHKEEKASGEIIIYNEFSESPQRLVRNTRFETPDGKIYRIRESIDVPGKTIAEGGEVVPGSIEATVYADEAGEEYNTGLTDFTIPGFEGLPQYEDFYARSKTHMTGGFSGDAYVPAEEDIAKARENLIDQIRPELVTKARAQTPESFVLHDGGIFIDFDEMQVAENSEEREAQVSLTGTLHGVIFKKSELAAFLADQATAQYDGHNVRILDIENLPITVVYEADSISGAEQVSFTLESGLHIVWDVDLEELKNELLGKSKEQFQSVLGQFSGIEQAEASVRPFWEGAFPQNSKEIKVKEILE